MKRVWTRISPVYFLFVLKSVCGVCALTFLFTGVYGAIAYYITQNNQIRLINTDVQQFKTFTINNLAILHKILDATENYLNALDTPPPQIIRKALSDACLQMASHGFSEIQSLLWIPIQGLEGKKDGSSEGSQEPNRLILRSKTSADKKIRFGFLEVRIPLEVFAPSPTSALALVGLAPLGISSKLSSQEGVVAFIPGATQGFVLKQKTPFTFSLFLKEEAWNLWLCAGFGGVFVLLTLGIGLVFHRRSSRLFQEKLDQTQVALQEAEQNFLSKKNRLSELAHRHELSLEATKSLDHLWTLLTQRQRALLEKTIISTLSTLQFTGMAENKSLTNLLTRALEHFLGPLEISQFALRSATLSVLSLFTPVIVADELDVQLVYHGKEGMIESDPFLFQVVLANLLNRSIQRLPPGGKLSILFKVTKKSLSLHIVDEGYDLGEKDPFCQKKGRDFLHLEDAILEKTVSQLNATLEFKGKKNGTKDGMNHTFCTFFFKTPWPLKNQRASQDHLPTNVILFPNA